MIDKIVTLLAVGVVASFGCKTGPSAGKCVPDIYPSHATLVKGDVGSALVTEFTAGNGCIYLGLDSINRVFTEPDTLPKISPILSSSGSSHAASLFFRSSLHPIEFSRLDSAQLANCSKIKTIRRIDFLPLATDSSGNQVVPVSPDSVSICVDSLCSRIVPEIVQNAPVPGACKKDTIFPPRDSALAEIRRRLQSAPQILTLIRFSPTYAARTASCMPPIQPLAARQATYSPLSNFPEETRLKAEYIPFIPWDGRPLSNLVGGHLSPLVPWNNPIVPPNLALPRPANAGDYFSPETLFYKVASLRGPDKTIPATFAYRSGVEYYQYRGLEDLGGGCALAPAPVVIGDSLWLDGTGLRVSNQPDCPNDSIDIDASHSIQWLFAPSTSNWTADFHHTSGNDNSWPLANDSIQVNGWKIALSEIANLVSVKSRMAVPSSFEMHMEGSMLSIQLDTPSPVRFATASGRILSHQPLPAGRSNVSLPSGVHGLLMVLTKDHTETMMAP